MLAETGVAGVPKSYFHKPSIEDWLEYHKLPALAGEAEKDTLTRILESAVCMGRGDTGVFGLRLQRHSFEFFTRNLAVLFPDDRTDLQRMERAFGRILFIHLTRPDKVEQAVSYVKAQQSGLWHRAADGFELERLSPHKDPVFDPKEIQTAYEQFVLADRDWTTWFHTQGIVPLRLTYDELSSAPDACLQDVLKRLGQDPKKADGVKPSVAKLADPQSEEWTGRFRQMLAG
ncbi:Stf0 family sulphotransferase [Roseibium denhamense]